MSEDQRLGFAFLAAVITFVLLLIRFFRLKDGKDAKFKKEAERNGCVTTATMDSRKYIAGSGDNLTTIGGRDTFIVKYKYTVDGRDYYKTINYYKEYEGVMDYPLEITVYYKKSNPEKAYSEGEIGSGKGFRKQMGCTAAIWMPLVVMVIVFNLLKYVS